RLAGARRLEAQGLTDVSEDTFVVNHFAQPVVERHAPPLDGALHEVRDRTVRFRPAKERRHRGELAQGFLAVAKPGVPLRGSPAGAVRRRLGAPGLGRILGARLQLALSLGDPTNQGATVIERLANGEEAGRLATEVGVDRLLEPGQGLSGAVDVGRELLVM